jgi:hypothetical protein
MGNESIILGIAGIVLGIAVYIKTVALIPALIPTIIGIALIVFYKEEDKVEQRKDLKSSKDKK